MNKDTIHSRAFERAALRSESHRVIGLLCLLGALLVFVIVRGVIERKVVLLLMQSFWLALAVAHELVLLRAVRKSLKDDEKLNPDLWVLNVIVESQLPTVGLLILLGSRWLLPHQVLVAPVVLLYFLLIILSTLRLRPMLTFFTGLLSSLGYLFTVLYVQVRFENSAAEGFASPVYYVYAGLILGAGVLAAMVAAQIKKHVAAALREAELQAQLEQVNHDLNVARSIQLGLLPQASPGLKDFEISGWNKPADQTGGDYFDWQTLPDGRVAISLADATGHGIGPALVTASCRAYARASFLSNGHQTGVLERLNQLLAEDLPSNRFVTFAVVLLNPATARAEVLSAGQGPILWYRRASDEIESLEAQGIPLGMIASVRYEQGIEAQLDAGDLLVLVTDGFYEWENPEGEQFGLDRLNKVIRESRNASPEELISRLRGAVETFCGGTKQQDDLTAVVLKRNNQRWK